MMPGYLSSLTHSVSIRLLTLPPHHPSLTHSLSLSSGYISLSHPMSQFFTLRFLFVTVTTDCHTVLDRIQVLAVGEDRVQNVESMRKGKKRLRLFNKLYLFGGDGEQCERHPEFSLGLVTFSGWVTVIYHLPLVICLPHVCLSMFLLL